MTTDNDPRQYAIYPAFAVPMAQDFFPEPDALNRDLKALLLAREAEGARHANPTPSLTQQKEVFESDFALFSWKEDCIQRLKQFCWASLWRTVQELNRYSPQDMQALQIYSHTWYHVTRRGGFTIAHTHPMASWSGVYCVSPGKSTPERPDSGALRFHNPHYYSNMFLDPGNLRPQAPYHHGTWNLLLQPGQLVLFPSWLSHDVLPFYGDDERITIAFNCWFGRKG
jgi:uncharacterized protein (TIGR02466 family)